MFYNTMKLTKFMLAREKITSTAWVLSMVLLNFLIVVLMGVSLMPYEADRLEFLSMLENPAMLAMVGPLYNMETSSMGAIYTLMMLVFMGITVAIMNVFLIMRHTRTDEEAGRYEVLRSLPCGRLAPVNAAMVTAVIVNAIMTVLFAITMFVGMHMAGEPMGFGAALLWGVTLGAIGITFAGIAALFSQLSSNSRGAMGYAFLLLGLFYFLRAGADMNPDDMGVLAFFSPLGLMSRTWAYVHNYWWPVLAILAYGAVFTGLAYFTCSIRDIDQGIIPARPGRAHGNWLLKSSFGLKMRLMGLSIFVWVLVLFITGLSYSTVLQDVDNFVAGNDMYRQMILAPTGLLDQIVIDDMPTEEIAAQMNMVLGAAGFNIVQMFANMIGFVMAMIATVPVLLFVLKSKSEEKAIRAELIVATATSKIGYLGGFVLIAFVSAVIIQLAQAFGLYSMASQALPNPDDLPLRFLIESALVYVPAMWIMGGIAVLLVGLLPKRTGLIWAYYGFTFFIMLYGRMIPELEFLARATPFGWVPQLPMDTISWPTLIVMTIIGAALTAIGLVAYRRRDINAITSK